MQLGPGRQIGDFAIVRPLAHGGMGTVFVARQQATGALRALKVMHPLLGADPRLHARFEQEARVGALIPSDHVVQTLAAGVDASTGVAWLAMELLEGMDLASYIAQRGRLAAAEALEILSQIAHALAAAHRVGVVHRDLKPENVFLANRRMVGIPYIVKVLDFGIAKLMSESTQATAALGTPAYMAPEQAHGSAAVSPASDVWAFGLLAFEMLTGTLLWRGDRRADAASILRQVLVDPIPLASERAAEELVAPAIPEGFDEWLARCVARNPSARFATIDRAIDLLQTILRPSGAAQRPLALVPSLARADPDAVTRLAEELAPSLAPAQRARRPLRVVYRERFGKTTVPAASGQLLLEVSIENEVPHHRVCGGRARCTTCRVLVSEGAHLLEPRTEAEARVAQARKWPDNIRLACQARFRADATGDLVVRRLVVDREDADLAQSGSGEVERFNEGHGVVLVARLDGLASFATRHLPYDTMHVAARAFRSIDELVRAHRGRVLVMQGASLVAFFGERADDVPRAALDAARAAVRIEPRMALINEYLGQNFGEAFLPVVGLHLGTIFVGQVAADNGAAPALLGEAVEVATAVARSASRARVPLAASAEVVRALGDVLALGRALEDVEVGVSAMAVHEVKGFAKPDVNFLVQSSFERILPQADEFSRRFYERLFTLAPEARPLFAHVEMDAQRKMLMDVLATAVRGLDDRDAVMPLLQALGRRHVAYGVEVKHYRAVGEALLSTIERHFGDELTPEVHLAWMEIYGVMARTMIEAAREQIAS